MSRHVRAVLCKQKALLLQTRASGGGGGGITLQSTLTLTELANHIALHGESLKTSTLLALQMQQLIVEVKFQRIVTMKKIPHEWHNDLYQRMDF